MAKKGTLTVRVISDTKAAERGLQQFANTVDKTGQRMENAGKQMTMFATVPIVGAMTLATSAAAELEQAVGGTEAVFGDLADRIGDVAKTAPKAMGLTEQQFREATTSIGGQLKRMTGDVEFAADKSIELTRVAADLAATYGGTTAEAVQALGAAFRGEADPAERFNLNLKIGAVNAKAVALGLAESTSSVSDAARAQATYALVMEQSADAQGQFERELDTASGQLQVARAEVGQAAAELGSHLLPIVTKVAGGVADLAGIFGDLPDPVQDGILALAGLVAAAGPTMTAISKVRSGASTAASAFETMRLRGMYLKDSLGKAGLAGALGVAGVAVAGFALVMQAHARNAAEARQQTQNLVDSIEELGEQDGTRAWLNDIVESNDLLRKSMVDAGLGVEDLAAALQGGDESFAAFREQLLATWDLSRDGAEVQMPKLRDEINGVASSFEEAGITGEDLAKVQAEVGDSADSAGDSVGDMGDEMSDAERQAKQLEDASRKLTEAFNILNGVQISADEALIAVKDDLAAMTEGFKENGTALDLNTEKGRANTENILAAIQAAQDHAAARLEETGSVDDATGALQAHVEQLKSDMRQAGFTEDQIASLIDRYNLTPEEITTSIKALGIETVRQQLDDLARERTVFFKAQMGSSVRAGGRIGGMPLNHAGGRVQKDEPTLVGRPGHEELFVPDRSGFIHSGIAVEAMRSAASRRGGDQEVAGGMNFYGPVTIGSKDVIADLDFWARKRTAGL